MLTVVACAQDVDSDDIDALVDEVLPAGASADEAQLRHGIAVLQGKAQSPAAEQTEPVDPELARWLDEVKLGQYKGLKSYQRINHFPGTWQLGRKDNLSRNCARQVRPPAQPPEQRKKVQAAVAKS